MELLVEIAGIMAGGFLFVTRVVPELKRFYVVAQVAWIFYSFVSKYLRDNPDKKAKVKSMVTQAMDHYMKTHPTGKKLAKVSDIDERIEAKLLEKGHPNYPVNG